MRKIAGYEAPNYTQTPNELFDLISDMGLAELKVTLAIVRKTLGWHKREDRISLTQLQELTGLSRQGVIDGLIEAVSRGTIKQHKHETGAHSYSLVVKPVDQDSQASGPDASQASRHTKETGNTLTKESIDASWIYESYLSIFSETVVSAEHDLLGELATLYIKDDVCDALRITELRNKKQRIPKKVAYTYGILKDWAANGRPVSGSNGNTSPEFDAARLAALSEAVNG